MNCKAAWCRYDCTPREHAHNQARRTHRRDIHQRGVTLCGLSAARCAPDFRPSDCDTCEDVQAMLEDSRTEHLSPVQARQRMA